jgi:hypothetical protein
MKAAAAANRLMSAIQPAGWQREKRNNDEKQWRN